MADGSQLKNTDLHTITRQQVYNIWMSLTRREWERDPRDDFRSAQMLVEEQERYILIEGLQEPGVSLAFATPCFNDKVKYYRSLLVPTSTDMSSTTRVVSEKKGIWLKPTVVHTDKDFAEVTAASIALRETTSVITIIFAYGTVFEQLTSILQRTPAVRSGKDLSDRVNDSDDDGDGTWSNTYAEELASLEPAENPEATEENDEQIREFMPVVHWATGPECESNPRMQRAFYRYCSNKAVSFLSEFKRPYEEAVVTLSLQQYHEKSSEVVLLQSASEPISCILATHDIGVKTSLLLFLVSVRSLEPRALGNARKNALDMAAS
ncbi:hypothetical protein V1524DRAFT_456277 [Lipomyces starkeyi]